MSSVPTTPEPKHIDTVPELAAKVKKLPPVGQILTKITFARMNGDQAAVDAAFAEGKELLQAEGKLPSEDQQGIETIRQYASDIEELHAKEKTAEKVLDDIEKSWPEMAEVDRLADELAKAKTKLQSKRHTSTGYLQQTEKVAKVKRNKKEAKEILSNYLIWHYRKTGELQVPMDDESGDARQVVLKGTLGRLTKYQTSLDLEPTE